MYVSARTFHTATTRPRIKEKTLPSLPGLPMLLLLILLSLAGIGLMGLGIARLAEGAVPLAFLRGISGGWQLGLGLIITVVSSLSLAGTTIVAPNEARVVQLFGSYRGTVHTPGMRWVNPFTTRTKISRRIRNHETSVLKVNDADGNPIEISAVVVCSEQATSPVVNTGSLY